MGIGVSLFFIAVGAILRWAVSASVPGANVHTIGLILFVVGLVGLALSFVLWSSVGSWVPGRRVATRETVVDEERHIDRAA